MIVRDDDNAMSDALKRGNMTVKKSPIHGYGVFADQIFQSGDIIEESYVLPVLGHKCSLLNYLFRINEKSVMALGFGSIYNHSDTPNAEYEFELDRQVLVFKSLDVIQSGEEIFIHYGEDWFSSRKLTPINASWRYRLKRPAMLAVRFAFVMILMSGLIGVVDYFNQSAHFSLAKISQKQIQKQAG